MTWSARVTVATATCSAATDETLLAQAKANASAIRSKATSYDSNAQIQELIRYGRTVLAQYPNDQATRKTLMNEKLRKVEDAIRAIYAAARRELEADGVRDVARAKCEDTKQLIQSTYNIELPTLITQEDTDIRYSASRAVKVITRNCGCSG